MYLHLNILMNLILDRYFRNFYCVFMIGDDLQHFYNVESVIYTQPDYLNLDLGCQGFVVQSENAASLCEQVEQKMVTNKIARFHERRYLFISNSSEVLRLSQLDHVKDVLLIQPGPRHFQLLTHRFTGRKRRGPTLVDAWFLKNQTFLHNSALYPEIGDFQGRTLTVSSFNYLPYDILGDSFETSGGIEIMLLSEFTKKMNLTVLLKDTGKEQWGRGFDNGTGYGTIGDITSQKSDIAVSEIFMTHRSVRADVSTAVIVSRVICLVPKPKEVINLLTPFTQFNSELWGLYAFFISFANLVVFVVLLKTEGYRQRTRKIHLFMDTTYCIVSILLLQPVKTENNFRCVKGLFLNLFLLVLIMTNAYSSGLASRMVIPSFGGEINTLRDLAKSNLPWGASDKSIWADVIDNDDREPYKSIVNNFEEHNETQLKTLRLSGEFGFPVEKLPSGYYGIQNYMDEAILENVQPMKEDLYWVFTAFLVRKNFVLLATLDHFILRVQQHGLLLKWEQKALELSNPRLQIMLKGTREKRTHEKLAWIHIRGVLLVWIVGVTFSTLCFVCEVLKTLI